MLQKKDKHFRKSFAYKGVSDFLGNGLLTNEGQDWLEKRRILQPKFSKKSIESLHQQVENTTEVFLLKRKDTKLDLQAFFTELITEIISAILFSEDKAEMKGRDLMDLLLTLRMHANDKLKTPLKLPLWFPYKANAGFKEAHYTIRTYVKGKVEARVNSNESKEDVLQWLVDLKKMNSKELSTTQLVDELITLYVAGQETTSNALTFLVQLIESHPEVKLKLLQALKANDDDYLQALIHEGLRFYPPVWAVSREAVKDVDINGLSVQKGDTVFVSIYAMHRNQDYWKNPNDFNPDRFLGKPSAQVEAYLPFGKGSRFCIGNHLAMLEMKVVLKQLYTYSVTCDLEDLQLITPMTLGIKNKISFTFS